MTDQSWTVRIDLDAWTGSMPAEAKLDAWTTSLVDYSPAVGLEPGEDNRVSITITLDTGSVRQAVQAAVRLVESATGTKALGVEALRTDEFDRRLNEPQIPPLIGQAEMATKLGVSRQRMAQLIERPDFPPEAVRTLAGPLFVAAQFESWEQSWERRNGRPRKVV